MALLVVRLNGEEVHSLQLEDGKEYIAGRSQDAQIVLTGGKGISRQHLKLYQRDGIWVVEALSKFMPMQIGTEHLQVIELREACIFTVPPYEFAFEPDPPVEEKASEPAAQSNNLPAFFQPRIAQPGVTAGEQTAPRPNNEATVAGGAATLTPYFRISYPSRSDDEVLKLEGELWVAGRESACEIPIDSPHISRRHFELSRTKEGFFITDLGSSNGTKLNGQRLPAHEPTRIESGDEIRVMNIEMTFEIRDTQFSNRIDRLPVPAFDPMLAGPAGHEPWLPAPMPMLEPTQYHRAEDLRPKKKGLALVLHKMKKNKGRVALYGTVGLVVLILALPTKKKDAKPNPREPAASASFETLSKEQKLVVKDSFSLARNLYVQGKYALCLTELAKMHDLIPQYENSKELQSFCEQGLELVRREEERARQQREKDEVENRIRGYVEQCKSTLAPTATMDETRRCLAPAIELSPEHHLVIEVLQTAQMHEEEKKFNEEQRQAQEAKAAAGRAHYKKAIAKYKSGKLSAAIKDLQKFLEKNYPKTDSLKDEARRQIASIKQEQKLKVEASLEQCRQHASKGKFKDAYLACDKATDEDPGHDEAKETKAKMLSELRREMKAIYEDSVLEESLGNVDSAKEKWKKIMVEDLDFDDYYSKAKSKLQKYGVGG